MNDIPAETTSAELVYAKINSETARINWKELQPFFASGKTLYVNPDLDLVEVGYAFHQDQAELVAGWLAQAQVCAVNTEQAKRWIANDTEVWAVVIKPWILIQDIDRSDTPKPTKNK